MHKLLLIYIGFLIVGPACRDAAADGSLHPSLGDTSNQLRLSAAGSTERSGSAGRGAADAQERLPNSGDPGRGLGGAGGTRGMGDAEANPGSAEAASRGGCGDMCAPFTLATGPSFPVALAADATHLYWTTIGGEGAVMRVALAGGPPEMLASNQVWPTAIAVDARSVYWSVDNKIMKMPRAGGPQTELVDGGEIARWLSRSMATTCTSSSRTTRTTPRS